MEYNIDYIFNDIASKTIRKYRMEKGLSLEEVVKKMKNPISRQALYKYECNLARMKNTTFIDICNALGVDPGEVFYEINEKLIFKASELGKELNIPISLSLVNQEGKIDRNIGYAFPDDDVANTFKESSTHSFDELEILFSKNKDILTDDDKEMIKFMIEKRKKEIDKQLGEE